MFGCSVETRGANARLCAESALCLTAMDSLFASANYRSFFRHRVKESGYNRGRWRTWTAEMHRGVRVGHLTHFQISPCITVQRPNHLERALFVTRTLHSAWGREGGREERRVCLPYLFHPFRAPTETSPMGTRPTSVLAPAVRPSVRPRPVVPPFLCTTRRLIGNNVAGTSFSAAIDLEWPRCGSEDSKSEFTQLFGL